MPYIYDGRPMCSWCFLDRFNANVVGLIASAFQPNVFFSMVFVLISERMKMRYWGLTKSMVGP